jgi:hypothetical protein
VRACGTPAREASQKLGRTFDDVTAAAATAAAAAAAAFRAGH